MKKVFLFLGTNVALIVTFTANGQFSTVKNITEPTPFQLTKAKQAGVEVPEFFKTLNLTNLTLKTKGNHTTGEGYTYTAVYKNILPGQTGYALLTLTTTSPTTVTGTMQLCDENGNVGNAPEAVENFTTALSTNATGTISNVDDVTLSNAASSRTKVDLTFITKEGVVLGSYPATVQTSTNGYTATLQVNDKDVKANLTVTDTTIDFTATWADAATAIEQLTETSPHAGEKFVAALADGIVTGTALNVTDTELKSATIAGGGTGTITVNLRGADEEEYGPQNIEGLTPDNNEYKGTFSLGGKLIEIAFEPVNGAITWEANYADSATAETRVNEEATANS